MYISIMYIFITRNNLKKYNNAGFVPNEVIKVFIEDQDLLPNRQH